MARGKVKKYGGLLACLCGILAARGTKAESNNTIDWSTGEVTAVASSPPDTQIKGLREKRLAGQSLAHKRIFDEFLKIVNNILISGNKTVRSLLKESSQIRNLVEGILRNFQVVATTYHANGQVDVSAKVTLRGLLLQTLVGGSKVQISKERQKTKQPVKKQASGLIILAKGINLKPALGPVIKTVSGKIVYAPASVQSNHLRDRGAVVYRKSLDNAIQDPRIGNTPSIIPAKYAKASDLIVSENNGNKIKNLPNVIKEGRVIIVIN